MSRKSGAPGWLRYHDDEYSQSYTKRPEVQKDALFAVFSRLEHCYIFFEFYIFRRQLKSSFCATFAMSADGQFFLSITGSIEHAEFYDVNNAYCKYGFHFGPEWSVVAGVEEGLTQMCKCSSDPRNLAVWNFPLEITFKSTNPYGWPQLIMSIYGLDIFGHDVIRGYGVCHLPLITGHHEKRVSVYVPESSSALQRFAAWLTGRRPELIDPAILASGGGRELTRMRVEGTVTVTFNVVLKDFFKLGYDNGERHRK